MLIGDEAGCPREKHGLPMTQSFSKVAEMTSSSHPVLFRHEYEALLEALRRDLRRERGLAAAGNEDGCFHGLNARMVSRLLEILRPRSSRDGRNSEQLEQRPALAATASIRSLPLAQAEAGRNVESYTNPEA